MLVDANGRRHPGGGAGGVPADGAARDAVGLRGIVVAGLLAALMSSLAGAFNACSTLFTMDFYRKFKPRASQAQLVWVGRVATAVMVLIGCSWIPVIQGARGLYDYLQGVQGYLGPPIFAVFFLGVFMKRLNAQAVCGAGGRLRAGRVPARGRHAGQPRARGLRDGYPEGSFLWIVNNIYFQYYSVLIFLVSVADDDRRQLRDGAAADDADWRA